MISTDFAANESWDDAWLSFKLLFQPWRWKSGNEIELTKQKLMKLVQMSNVKCQISLFLSGRSALFTLLKSLNLPNNSEVIVQAFTCEAVVLPILANNLKPEYIDIESETYSMDVKQIAKKLTSKSKVLILQHTFGITPKYRKEILEFAHRKNLIVIEDLAHGWQHLTFDIRHFNHFLLLSFGRSKSLSSVFGGAILSFETMEQSHNLFYPSYWFIFKCLLYKPLVMLIKSTYDFYVGKLIHKITNLLGLLLPEITAKEKEGKYDLLLEKAYPNGLAILLLQQLKKFELIQQNRLNVCSIYNRGFKNIKSYNDSLIRFPYLVDDRSKVLDILSKNNIFLGKWYDQVVAPKDLDLKKVEYKMGSCPTAEEICKKIINLPTNLSSIEAKRVTDMLKQIETK